MRKISPRQTEDDMGLKEACELAACEAARALNTSVESMGVVAWYDRRSKRSYPEVGFSRDVCVNWEQQAASRGADIRVELEDGNLIILCGSTSKH